MRHAAMFVAVILAAVLHWYLNLRGPIPEPWDMPAWRQALSPLLGGLCLTLPGAAVGVLVGRNGILLGGMVAFLAQFPLSANFWELNLAPEGSAWAGAMVLLHLFLAAVAKSLGHVVISAAAGGAGELLRSNKSLQRTA